MKRIKPQLGTAVFATVLFFIISFIACGQSITYENTQDMIFSEGVKNETNFNSYTAKDGTILKIGDTLVIGQPSTNTNAYTTIYSGKVNIAKSIFSPPIQVTGAAQKETVTIQSIFVYHTKASKKSPLYIALYILTPNVGMSNRTILDYEKAILLNEIINPNRPLTKEEAIKKLKEAKDLLDLGMISQAKFDSLKVKLSPIILKQ
jgi:hypothetical protein